jgi:hypothetical protein
MVVIILIVLMNGFDMTSTRATRTKQQKRMLTAQPFTSVRMEMRDLLRAMKSVGRTVEQILQ